MKTKPTTTASDTPAIDIIAQEAKTVAAAFGITCAGDLAAALIDRLTHRLGAQKIYIPSQTTQQAKRRSIAIRAQFTGANLKDLAKIHRLSPRQVRNILTKADHNTR